MPRISKEKLEKVQEQILLFLYTIFPKQVFTVDISKEIARDEEFVKNLLLELEKKELVVKVNKNSGGIVYQRRLRWRISNKAYEIYAQLQNKSAKAIENLEKLDQN